MRHYTKEQMQRARKADLYDFLLRYHGGQFKREGQSLRMCSNGSISVKRGYSGYVDFATDEKGNSVDFLVRHMEYELDEAVFALCGDSVVTSSYASAFEIPSNAEDVEPEFPKPADGRYRQLFAFLTGRGLPVATVQSLIDQGLLYQSMEKNNAVFINREKDWAELRGTYTYGKKQFHGIAEHCRPDGFWWFRFGNANTAYICESAIDAISLYVLHRQHGKTDPAYYISVGGAAKQPAIDRIKKKMQSIILAVDNDAAGQKCRDRNPELSYILPVKKDWNEDLQDGKYYEEGHS